MTLIPIVRGQRILAVEDSLVNLKLLEMILGKEGYQLTVVTNSLEALPLALSEKPDLILLDIMMPGMSGMDILASLKQNSETMHIPVIMVTARNKGSDVRDALENGAVDYIKKPLDEVEVIARVRSVLRFKAYHDQLLEMALRDSLTGLYNHAPFMDLLEKEIYNQRRKGGTLALAMMDIDHFKRINDNFGHQAGDAALMGISRLLSQTLRKGDYLGRYGGEEFALLLPGVPLDQARALCERLRLLVADHPISYEETRIKATISLGLAFTDLKEPISGPDLVKRADVALYRAKESGRNRLELDIGIPPQS